jgi:Polyketide cyclase / dehydrase and lipid transport
MPSVSKTVELALSQEDAFALATDTGRFEEWLTLHKGWPGGMPASLDPGAEFSQKLAIMGMPADVAWAVIEHEAPSRFVMHGEGPMGARLATTIVAQGDGVTTVLSYEAEFSGGGIQGPMGEVVTKKAGEEIEASLEKLKGLA